MTVVSSSTVRMRDEAVCRLNELGEFTKAQQAFLNSCSDATWITDEQRHEIRWLLSALIEHRRRVRVTARLWRTLTPAERVGDGLVAETTELIDENGYFAPLIESWRSIILGRTKSERKLFWLSMMELAERNLSVAADTGGSSAQAGAARNNVEFRLDTAAVYGDTSIKGRLSDL